MSFFHRSSALLAVTPHALLVWDAITAQVLWTLQGIVHAHAVNTHSPLDPPRFAVALQSMVMGFCDM